jgi:hypothetical protein
MEMAANGGREVRGCPEHTAAHGSEDQGTHKRVRVPWKGGVEKKTTSGQAL